MVLRGFTSLTFVHEGAQALLYVGKPAWIYYFGDHDTSGVAVDRAIDRPAAVRPGCRDPLPAPGAAVISRSGKLPTRLTKKSDSRSDDLSRGFRGD